MREAALEDLFRRLVVEAGGMTEKLVPVRRGVPDRIALWPGGVVDFVELKTVVGRLSPAQELWHRRVSAIGANVYTLRGADEVRAYVKERSSE